MNRSLLLFAFLSLLAMLPLSAQTQDLTVTWGPETPLSPDSITSLDPRLAIYGDDVHVVWTLWSFTAVIRSSHDRGNSWGPLARLHNYPESAASDLSVAVAACEGSVHVEILQQQNFVPWFWGTVYTRSDDQGQSWPPEPMTLIEDGSYGSISVWDSLVNVIAINCAAPYNCEILHRLSTDGGHSFLPQDTIGQAPTSQPTKMIALQNYVCLVYAALTPTPTMEVFFQRSMDGGFNFEEPVILSTADNYNSQLPSLAGTASGDIYVCWYDYKYSPYQLFGDILMRRSPDFGEHWDEEIQVTDNHIADYSAIAVQDSQVHIVWVGYPTLSQQESELFYRNSPDRGLSWSEPEQLTFAHDVAVMPDMGMQNDTLHLVWRDDRNGWSWIYYRRAVVTIAQTPILPNAETPKLAEWRLTANPNPFNQSTTISINLPMPDDVRLSIFDIAGSEVIRLWHGPLDAGQHPFVWRPMTSTTAEASGIYFAVFESVGQAPLIQKIVLLK